MAIMMNIVTKHTLVGRHASPVLCELQKVPLGLNRHSNKAVVQGAESSREAFDVHLRYYT